MKVGRGQLAAALALALAVSGLIVLPPILEPHIPESSATQATIETEPRAFTPDVLWELPPWESQLLSARNDLAEPIHVDRADGAIDFHGCVGITAWSDGYGATTPVDIESHDPPFAITANSLRHEFGTPNPSPRPTVLVFVDRADLTLTADFGEAGTDTASVTGPVMALVGQARPWTMRARDSWQADEALLSHSITASDSDGNEVWTIESAPAGTLPNCWPLPST